MSSLLGWKVTAMLLEAAASRPVRAGRPDRGHRNRGPRTGSSGSAGPRAGPDRVQDREVVGVGEPLAAGQLGSGPWAGQGMLAVLVPGEHRLVGSPQADGSAVGRTDPGRAAGKDQGVTWAGRDDSAGAFGAGHDRWRPVWQCGAGYQIRTRVAGSSHSSSVAPTSNAA